MLLTLKVLNSDAALNNWEDEGGSAQIVRGSDAKLIVQLFQAERAIRYVPIALATMSMVLIKSDQTTVTLTGSFPFVDDRSILEFDISAAQSLNLISQNLVVTLVEGLLTNIAVLPLGLKMIPPTQIGC